MSPVQHGEEFVTADGGTDLILGITKILECSNEENQ